MSLPGSVGHPVIENGDIVDNDAGYVATRSRRRGGSVNSRGGGSSASQSRRTSPATHRGAMGTDSSSYGPFHHQRKTDADFSSYVSSPPRLGKQHPSQKKSGPESDVAEFALPPEISSTPPSEDQSFKSWLTSGILFAAGVTLSTTGQIMATPLNMTKNILLPGLLALFVDTLDAKTSPRVKDWFRILSSSVYHLFKVLGSTIRGQAFSKQFWVVVQDVGQAFSAPETRQVLVDGMAASVKFADALNTPETQLWLEQMSILGCRLVDAAASGKSKQLIQDSKDMVWKGIEMATDPATTLALAEVTAHLCHALEDMQQALNPTPRSRRNAQNQATYLDPLQMVDYPEQYTMEEIILSCIGKYDDESVEEDDAGSIPSNVGWNDDGTEPKYRDWAERSEKVNVKLLKEKILDTPRPTPRKEPLCSPEGSPKSTVTSTMPPRQVPFMNDLQGEPRKNVELETSRPPEEQQDKQGMKETAGAEGLVSNEGDIEDIEWTNVSTKSNKPEALNVIGFTSGEQRTQLPAITRFYQTLDDLLKQKRAERRDRQAQAEATINNSSFAEKPDLDRLRMWHAEVKKLAGDRIESLRANSLQRVKTHLQQKPLPSRNRPLVLAGGILLAFFVFLWSCFALYGLYTLVTARSRSWLSLDSLPLIGGRSSDNSQVTIRVIREVVHVLEDGTRLPTTSNSPLTQEEIAKVTECVASAIN